MKFKDLSFEAEIKACKDYQKNNNDKISLNEVYRILVQNDEDFYTYDGEFIDDNTRDCIEQISIIAAKPLDVKLLKVELDQNYDSYTIKRAKYFYKKGEY